ncbi:MAG: PQQ-like beta-propeller repeat protein [Alphaproteobacteria bacterium]|nr:PQQ-like beta-propeller repeat protein [Alphaproteobacteria bacterium]
MKNPLFIILLSALLYSCSKTDPILPGERHSIFNIGGVTILNQPAPETEKIYREATATDWIFEQNQDNTIWKVQNGNRERVFSGLATPASVSGKRTPVWDKKYVYAGLSTGEVIKINQATRNLEWLADVYRSSAMTGGAPILDIVAPVIVHGDAVYVGGLGGEFCRLHDRDGRKVWCVNISTGVPFLVTSRVSFVVATDNHLYAIDNKNGDIYWQAEIRKQAAPEMEENKIKVAREKFDAISGENSR